MKRLLSLVLMFALLLSLAPGVAAIDREQPTPLQAADRLRAQARGPIEIAWDDATSVPRFIYGDLPTDATRSPEGAARSFFTQYSDLFRMTNPTRDLALDRIEQDELGMTHVRFTQAVNNVPVFGGQLIVHLRNGRITAINGVYFPQVEVDTTAKLSQADAISIARTDIGDAAADLHGEHSGLTIYVDKDQAHLAWKINLYSEKNLGNWLYFVDAHDGRIVHKLNQLDTAKSLKIYNMNHAATGLPGALVCGTGTSNPNCANAGTDADAQGAFNNSSKVYDYYFLTFGRDSYDNLGTQLVSSVHYRNNYYNAFWNGTQMVYGDGDTFAQAFDVIAHELTHGVTQETDNLIYEHQSGALNESWSDVMAVFAGCSPTTGTANCNWLMGDTLTGGAIRDLSNPPAYGDPDHFSDYLWLPLEVDNGGVHTNSGIPNKAAYLLTAGDTFHNVTVTGIGYTKAEQIYYRAMTRYMTTYSNFMDTRNALHAACIDKVGTVGITLSNCDQVYNAWAAVGVGTPAAALPGPYRTYLPLTRRGAPSTTCVPSYIQTNGGFEAGAAGWAESSTGGFTIVGNHGVAHDGVQSAWLGGYDDALDLLYQTINIPAERTALQASFYVHVETTDSLSTAFDKLYASIQPVGSVALPEIWTVDNRDASFAGWWHITLTYNELPYAGQAMRLYFRAITDFSDPTSFFVDTVTLQVQCTRYTAVTNLNGLPAITIEPVADRPAPERSTLPRTK